MSRAIRAVPLLLAVGAWSSVGAVEYGRALRGHYGGAEPTVVARLQDGQVEVTESGSRVLRYNYRTVEPAVGFLERVAPANSKYARPRSDYIHPLYGPDGEELTLDWAVDHPHHRGIYWAWPEVDYGGERGDLHALQRVWARPTGKLRLVHEADYAQIEAENMWVWEDETPIVREEAIIRVHRQGQQGRWIDLDLRFAAVGDDVAIARRGTELYGGLNIRLSAVQDLRLVFHTDPDDARPRRAWADSLGVRAVGRSPVGFAVIPKETNPHHPGQWVQYPELPWFQPTFPTSGTRYLLRRNETLRLEYRLWVRRGAETTDESYDEQWRTYNAP